MNVSPRMFGVVFEVVCMVKYVQPLDYKELQIFDHTNTWTF